ncbi:hypothetical protein [Petrachloros mirabilis]
MFQASTILACVLLEYANAEAGTMKYQLPQFLFWLYLWIGLSATAVALATLMILWVKTSFVLPASGQQRKTLLHLIILSIVNLCAVPVWCNFGGLVFFGADGNR